jgi:hypothetical protein
MKPCGQRESAVAETAPLQSAISLFLRHVHKFRHPVFKLTNSWLNWVRTAWKSTSPIPPSQGRSRLPAARRFLVFHSAAGFLLLPRPVDWKSNPRTAFQYEKDIEDDHL